MTNVLSFLSAHYGHVITFSVALFLKDHISSAYAKIKSYFTAAEADVKKVL